MPKRVDILSLFPEYFTSALEASILGRAQRNGWIDVRLVNIRDFASEKYCRGSCRRVDDRPYGGGPGMVLMAEPVAKAVRSCKEGSAAEKRRTVYLSPQGNLLTAAKCRELAEYDNLILLCGHYEGIDERAIESCVDEEISIGDYVLTNGCLAALVLLDAVSRFYPHVLGDDRAAIEDSFEEGHFDCPHYTRPEVFEGRRVPEVLLSGNHKEIAKWRKMMGLQKTARVRPELL
jgi:tRNA (guanine37-N1)-methyltransferase